MSIRTEPHLFTKAEYTDDMGVVLWWEFPIVGPPYLGTPYDKGIEVAIVPDIALHIHTSEGEDKDDPSFELTGRTKTFFVGGWPGYHTHFTLLAVPDAPK